MFGYRSDGKKLKTVPAYFKLTPALMKTRNDSEVFFKQDVELSAMEEYINKQAEKGIKFSYMDIVYAAIIRVISQRPQLNRFVMNGRLYKRNSIFISLAVKKSHSDESDESTSKLEFNGTENIFEIKEKLDKFVSDNKKEDFDNSTDSFAKFLSKTPYFMIKAIVNFVWFLDNHGMCPKSIINLSPFHTSAFLTNVGSIGIDSIYHHIYNFGTTSLFLSMGKKKTSYIYEDDELKKEKCITIAFVGDERICDGYYFANSFKLLSRLLTHPEMLEENVEKQEDCK